MTEPIQVLVNAALDRLRPLARELRSQGWDATLRVSRVDVGEVDVELVLTIAERVPVEATNA